MSHVVDLESEWRTRPINLFSVLKSFVYQLRPGQDLTRVSLPTELSYPFSTIEQTAFRLMEAIHLLFKLDDEKDPLERFLIVQAYILSLPREGETKTMVRKPYNPILDEVHHTWIDHKDGSRSYFVGEQVSHHPPISAFHITNTKHNFSIDAAVGFSVTFGSNNASIHILGPVIISTPSEKFVLNQTTPNMVLRNVIWGEKYLIWLGPLTLYSDSSHLFSKIKVSEEVTKDNKTLNPFSGVIYQSKPETEEEAKADELAQKKRRDEDDDVQDVANYGKPLYQIRGMVGKGAWMDENDAYSEKARQFFTPPPAEQCEPLHFLDPEHRLPLSSIQAWKATNEALIANDIIEADTQKKIVEAEQRVRQAQKRKDRRMHECRHFYAEDPTPADAQPDANGKLADQHFDSPEGRYYRSVPKLQWTFRDNFHSTEEDFSALKETAAKESKEREELLAQARANGNVEGEDGNCVVS